MDKSTQNITIEKAEKRMLSNSQIAHIIKEINELIAKKGDDYFELCTCKHHLSYLLNKYEHIDLVNNAFEHLFPQITKALQSNNFSYPIDFYPLYDSNNYNRMPTPLSLEFAAFIMNGQNRNEMDRPLLNDILAPVGISDANKSMHKTENHKFTMIPLFGKKAAMHNPRNSKWKYEPEK